MITKYLTHLRCSFSPLVGTSAHLTPRLLLALVPANARQHVGGGLKVSQNVLQRGAGKASIVAGFKDGKELIFEEGRDGTDLAKLKLDDIVEMLDRHSRGLGRQEELNG